ncbi:MAG: TonB-dependent receptor [Nitrospirae bacterium]|nr:TonB-dependent receptor [Nitrospirota bacterium]
MTKRAPVLIVLILGCSWASAQEIQTGSLSGRVMEKGTKQVLSGANLFLEPIGETVLSDEAGGFRFQNLAPGEYRLIIAAVNYRKLEPIPIRILEGQDQTVTLYLEREPISMLEIVVESERKPPDPGRQTLQREEVRKIPGAGGDLIMAVQSLPGVTAAGGFGGDFLSRGSGPLDNFVLLDQMPVFLTFHFGGLISTIGADLVQSMDFYAGGFPARYGDAMGAVLDISSRDGRKDRIESRLNVSPVLIEARVEGPAGSDANFFLAGRRGLIEYLPLPTPSGTTVIPAFNDYQAKVGYDLSARHRLSLLFFGSHDGFVFETNEPDPRDPILSSFNLNIDFHNQGLSLRSYLTPQLTSTLTLFNSYNTQRTAIGPDIFLNFVSDQVRLKGHFVYELPSQTVATGFEVGHVWYSIDSHFVRFCREGEPACNLTNAERIETHFSDTGDGGDLYLQDTLHLPSRLDLTLGGRADYFGLTRALDFSPRLSALLHLTEDQRIKAAYGYYYEWPDRNGEFIKGFGTPDIGSSRAIHYVLGYERRFSPAVDLDLQVYYKALDHLIVTSNDPGVVYDNDGVGYATGAELLLRHRLTDRFFGWLSYAYSISKRRNHSGEDWRLSDYDRPEAITLVGSYQLTQRWNLGGRWRFTSGAPYTPVIGSAFDPVNNRYDPIYGEVNSRRLPPSHRLDLRAEYKKAYDTWILTTYLEIWNVYNRRNPIGIDYSDDFSEKKFTTEPGLIPFIGITAEF